MKGKVRMTSDELRKRMGTRQRKATRQRNALLPGRGSYDILREERRIKKEYMWALILGCGGDIDLCGAVTKIARRFCVPPEKLRGLDFMGKLCNMVAQAASKEGGAE